MIKQKPKSSSSRYQYIVQADKNISWQKWDEIIDFCADTFVRGKYMVRGRTIEFINEADATYLYLAFGQDL